jgi:hypothetical protein
MNHETSRTGQGSSRMVHAHVMPPVTHILRNGQVSATVPAMHSIRHLRAMETPLVVHEPARGLPSYAVGLQIGRCTPCVHKAIFCTQHPRCVRGISADFTSKLWRMSAPLPCREHIVNAVEPLCDHVTTLSDPQTSQPITTDFPRIVLDHVQSAHC